MTAGQLSTPRHLHVPHVPRAAAMAAVAGVVAVAGAVTIGTLRPATRPAPGPAIAATSGHADLVRVGEFILGPGNAQPIGIPYPSLVELLPAPGEFRLGPGNTQPPGITSQPQRVAVRVEPLYAPGEFIPGPGNLAPLGIPVPLYDTPMPGEFRLGPGNTQPPGITVPLATGAG